jgi:hypothetical protein
MQPEDSHQVRRRWLVWKWLLLVVLIVAAVILLAPHVIRTELGHGRDFREAVHNMRSIGLALAEFQANYETFPNDQTRTEVLQRHPESKIPLGTSTSNDYFHQLLASGNADSPSYFHGYGISKRNPPELPDAKIPLPPDTCGYAYIITDAESNAPSRPLVVYPLVPGKFIFDKKLCKLWGNRALVLHADSSVRAYPIDASGRLMIDGLDLFDHAQPHWQGRGFQVKWPE